MAIADANFLILLLDEKQEILVNSETGEKVEQVQARIALLLKKLEKRREKLLIPTPVLSELLSGAQDAGEQYLATLAASSVFKIVPFDQKSAIELALMNRAARASGDKNGGVDQPYQKTKLDRQIVSIAVANAQTCIYSDDIGVRNFAEKAGLQVISISELELPEHDSQMDLHLVIPPEADAGSAEQSPQADRLLF